MSVKLSIGTPTTTRILKTNVANAKPANESFRLLGNLVWAYQR